MAALAVPLIGSRPVNFLDSELWWLGSVFLLIAYTCSKSLAIYLVRTFGEGLTHRLRVRLVERMINEFRSGTGDLDSLSWRTTVLVDMQRLRALFEDSIPRLITSALVAIISATVIVFAVAQLIPLVIGLGVSLFALSLLARKVISSRAENARSSEENLNMLLSFLVDGREFFFGNSAAPASTREIVWSSDNVRENNTQLNRVEALLEPFITLMAFAILGSLFYVVTASVELGSTLGRRIELALWLFVGFPAVLDVLSAVSVIFRNTASISRVTRALHSNNAGIMYQLAESSGLLESVHKRKGGLWKIQGPSGSGKTSQMRFLCSKLGSAAYVPQQRPVLDQNLLNIANLYFGLDHRSDWYPTFASHLEALGMSAANVLALDSLSHLSGGEKGRVLLCLALSTEAEVILLDEPEAGLDRSLYSKMAALLSSESNSRTVVSSGHFQ